MPYAVLEAAYCRRPLVLSDIEPHRQLGLPQASWFPPQDAGALYDAVCRAAETDGSSENAAYVAERFSLETWTQTVLSQLFPKKEQPV